MLYAHSTTPILLSFLFGRTPFYILEKKVWTSLYIGLGRHVMYIHMCTNEQYSFRMLNYFSIFMGKVVTILFLHDMFFFFGIVLYIESLHPTSYYHQTSFFVFGMSFFSSNSSIIHFETEYVMREICTISSQEVIDDGDNNDDSLSCFFLLFRKRRGSSVKNVTL